MPDKSIKTGNVGAGSFISTGYVGGDVSINNLSNNDGKSLAEAAAEIQQLLEQLSQTYPTKTASEKANVAAKAIVAIEEKPGIKSKILKALKAGGAATFMELVNHPVINILTPMLESLLEEEQS